ncbi:ABC transporter substrate-binding protein, partial [Rhizobiaceae sp. 2RAB30]
MPIFAAWVGAGLIVAGTQAALAETPQTGGTLRSAWVGGGAAEKLDPATWLTSMELARISAVFDRLTKINEKGKPELMLAQAMTPNADASVWTVKLRPGVQFHDGTPLTAADVLYSFKSAVERGYYAATNFSMIDLAKSRVVDDQTVEF